MPMPASVAVAQGGDATPVDLARVPLPPQALPEPGFQFAQGGDLDLLTFVTGVGSIHIASDDFDVDVPEKHWRQGYASVSLLLSDRASVDSDWLAAAVTFVIELDSPAGAVEVADWLNNIGSGEEDPTETIGGVLVASDADSLRGFLVHHQYLILTSYNAIEAKDARWTPEAIAGMADAMSDRLDRAIADQEAGEIQLGIGNVMIAGPDAGWATIRALDPLTQHYRVLEGAVVPYPGELEELLADDVIPGVTDLFIARQGIGGDGSSHLIGVTLARFETEADAERFAANIDAYDLAGALDPGVTYDRAVVSEDGGTLTRARLDADDGLLSGYRSVRREGEIVQVVEWLAGGNARVNEAMMGWLVDQQEQCVRALPEPCALIPERDLPRPIDLPEGTATPEPAPIGDGSTAIAIGSPEFGWSVSVPDDGWKLTGRESDIEGSDYHKLQSGRSIAEFETVIDRHADPQRCVLDNLALLEASEERSVIDLGSDDETEAPAGSDAGHAWAIYTVEPLADERADQEYTIRYDCYALPGGDASLVMTHVAPRSLWEAETSKADRLRAGIWLAEAARSGHVEIERAA